MPRPVAMAFINVKWDFQENIYYLKELRKWERVDPISMTFPDNCTGG